MAARQHDRIGKDVSQFLPQPLTVNQFGIPVLFPEKLFIHFGRLYGKSQRQVLGVMELFPIPLVTELNEQIVQLLKLTQSETSRSATTWFAR